MHTPSPAAAAHDAAEDMTPPPVQRRAVSTSYADLVASEPDRVAIPPHRQNASHGRSIFDTTY